MIGSKWQKRYMVLKNGKVRFYEDASKKKTDHKKVINMPEV
jgi:hypothetical protein